MFEHVSKIIANKHSLPSREEAQLHYTSKESVCAAGWKAFLAEDMMKIEMRFLGDLFNSIKLRKANAAKRPYTPFEMTQLVLKADTTETLEYCEGFRIEDGRIQMLPWLLIHNKVIDFSTGTIRKGTDVEILESSNVGTFRKDTAYIGRKIPKQLVLDILEEEQRLGVMVLKRYDHYYGEIAVGSMLDNLRYV